MIGVAVCVPVNATSVQLSMLNKALSAMRDRRGEFYIELFSAREQENMPINNPTSYQTLFNNHTGIGGCHHASTAVQECLYVFTCEGKQEETIDTVHHVAKEHKMRFYVFARDGGVKVIEPNTEEYKEIKSKAHIFSKPMFKQADKKSYAKDSGYDENDDAAQYDCPLNQIEYQYWFNIVYPLVYWKERNNNTQAQAVIDYAISEGHISSDSTIEDVIFVKKLPKCTCGRCKSL